MVCGRVVGGILVGAVLVLARLAADHVGSELLIKEDLECLVVVEVALGRKVGHDVLVMNHSVKAVGPA